MRISGALKRRLQQQCRKRGLTLRDALDDAVRAYVHQRETKSGGE